MSYRRSYDGSNSPCSINRYAFGLLIVLCNDSSKNVNTFLHYVKAVRCCKECSRNAEFIILWPATSLVANSRSWSYIRKSQVTFVLCSEDTNKNAFTYNLVDMSTVSCDQPHTQRPQVSALTVQQFSNSSFVFSFCSTCECGTETWWGLCPALPTFL